MEGLELLKILIESTGLPADAVERELNKILAKRGQTAATITLESVREILSDYLQDVLLEAKQRASVDLP